VSLCPSCNAEAGESSRFCPSCGASIVRGPPQEDYSGKLVAGKFRVEKLIGEGGMGKVFRATQLSLDKTVVLKVLRPTLLSDPRTVARFQREAKAASRLNHPNSISVIDFGQDADGSMYIAMEYVNGQDLHQVLSNEGPLHETRIVRIVSQMLSALSAAHAAGIIHRDLKPENIMVEQRRGESDFVKVLDFGIAKIQDFDQSEGAALTRAGFVCGTPEYMSPEQARGMALDARSDLYAVGVICYQCATNQLPFEAESAVALATMHLTTPPVPPREKRPDAPISDAMEALILRALAKDPNDRPQSAEVFRRELLALGREAEATRVQSAPPPPPRPRRKHTEATKAARPSKAASRVAEEEKTALATNPGPRTDPLQPRRMPLVAAAVAAGVLVLGVGSFLVYRHMSVPVEPVALPPSTGKEPVITPPRIKPTASDIDLAAEDPKPKPLAAGFIKEGDAAVAGGRYDDALENYLKAHEAQPSATTSKRVALAYLLKSDGTSSARYLREYMSTSGSNPPGGEAIERFLRSAP